ncbi:MAG: beta-glucuronidase [Phycisphaerae bacterium]|nr:beta-glucuronidase [Phycisphaerae bacterium]
MLYPQENAYREHRELSGFWQYRFDAGEQGRQRNWPKGFEPEGDMPVPASWNELFCDQARRDFLGTCWYQRSVFVPASWQGRRVVLRIGSACYRAEAWVNGRSVGTHEGGHLPFELAVDEHLAFGAANLVVIAVNATLDRDTLPPGNLGAAAEGHSTLRKPHPDVEFDFFPYGGIHRPVSLCAQPVHHIADVRVDTDIDGTVGRLDVMVRTAGRGADTVRLRVAGQETACPLDGDRAAATVRIPEARFWSPASPHLYALTVQLCTGERVVDEYTLNVGIRTVEVTETQILLNGKPIYLRGFGKHEDFPVLGKGLNHAVLVKDFELMRWVGANSFRTTHYPYAEEVLDMADRLGVLVISETPAVGINFEYDTSTLLGKHKSVVEDWIARDRNHPSVVMWCLANEPRSDKPSSKPYFAELIEHARRLDASRPMTVVTCDGEWVGRGECHVMELCDVICINRYYGWYVGGGRIEEAVEKMSQEMDAIHARHKRPVVVTEFGADCVAGLHALPSFVFSEEYQAELIRQTVRMIEAKPYAAGEHIWNFADFMTGQVHTRVVGNKKGIFTRDRQPKLAAHVVRALWNSRSPGVMAGEKAD